MAPSIAGHGLSSLPGPVQIVAGDAGNGDARLELDTQEGAETIVATLQSPDFKLHGQVW